MCLSSPEGESNYFSGLMNLKNSRGQPFFHVIDCFQICQACQQLERAQAIFCTHVPNTAHWISKKKSNELKHLYKASPEDAIREFGGIVVSDYRPALNKYDVNRIFSQPRVVTHNPPRYVFTACDPNGGGPSHMSICSGYFTPMGHVVVSLFCFVEFGRLKTKVLDNGFGVCDSDWPRKHSFDHHVQVLHELVKSILLLLGDF